MIGSNILRFNTIDSTSDEAKRIAKDVPEGTVIIADEQTKGRGKPGSSWYSPLGGLYFSIILKPNKSVAELTPLTLLVAKSIKCVLANSYGLESEIKPPNDILVSGKKVCGILTEKNKNSLIIGIGLNISTKSFIESLKGKATSINLEVGRSINKAKIFDEILKSLESEYLNFINDNV